MPSYLVSVGGSRPLRIPARDARFARSRGTRRILSLARPDLAGPGFAEKARSLEELAKVERVK